MSTWESTDIVVVIPTHNPAQMGEGASNHLLELVNAATTSGFPVVLSDDASTSTSDSLLREVAEIDGVTVIRHFKNEGIARGLNDGLRIATELNARWLLTIDQDSHIDSDYAARMGEIANTLTSQQKNQVIGAVAPEQIHDASGSITYPTRTLGSLSITEEVIQSGALWNVEALHSVGGFDEKLAIDAVDAAACLRLRESGCVIALTPDVTLRHTLGNARQVQLLGRSVMVTGHSPKRRASIVRNRLRLAPAEFKQSPTHAFRTLRRVAVNEFLGWVSLKNSRNTN